MPFGLTNAPAVFQTLVNDVLRDMLNKFSFVCLDDILIYFPDINCHVSHVWIKVLKRFLKHQLFVKAEKCEVHRPSVPFLGYVFTECKVQLDPAKIKAVNDWPTPTSRKEIQRILDFANIYRKFIWNFSAMAASPHALTSSKL